MRSSETLRQQARQAEWLAGQVTITGDRENLLEQARKLYRAAEIAQAEEASRGLRAKQGPDKNGDAAG